MFAQTGGVLFNDDAASGPGVLHPRRRWLPGPALRRLVGRSERARRQPVLRAARRRHVRGPPGGPRRPAGPGRRERHHAPPDAGSAGGLHPQRRVVRLDGQPGPQRPHPARGRRDLLRHGPPGLHAPDHLVPGDRRRPVLVQRAWATRARPTPRQSCARRCATASPTPPACCRPTARRRSKAENGALERRHAVAADADQHGADLRRHGAVLRQRRRLGQRHHAVRLDRQQLDHPGRPDGGRRLGPRASPAPSPTSATASCRTPPTPTCSARCRCRTRTTTRR